MVKIDLDRAAEQRGHDEDKASRLDDLFRKTVIPLTGDESLAYDPIEEARSPKKKRHSNRKKH